MTRTNFWLVLFGLLMAGCPTTPVVDDTDDTADADTDTDSDTDSDADVYATIVARTGIEADFAINDDDEVVCEGVMECRMDVPAPNTYEVFAKAENYIFGDKFAVVDKHGDAEAEWGEGQWGADFSGDWVEAEDSDYPGVEHEVEVTRKDEFVKIGISLASGCARSGALMTGFEFNYDEDEDGYWCNGYGTTDLEELVFDVGTSGGSAHMHLVHAD